MRQLGFDLRSNLAPSRHFSSVHLHLYDFLIIGFLSHLLYVRPGHNKLLDNFLVLAEFVRQFAKLVLELVQLHVLNIQVVLRVLYNLSDLRHIIVIFCVVSIIRITVIFVGSLDIKGYGKNIFPFRIVF